MTPPALLLVDLQADFLRRPGLEPHPGSLTAAAELWLQAWRTNHRPVAHLHTRVARSPDRRMPHWKTAGCWHCEEGTPGALPPSALAPRNGEPVFRKQGFLPPDPAPLLDWALGPAGGRVVVAGVMTHACVQALAMLLHGEGVRLFLARDALGSDRPLHAAAALEWMGLRGISCLESPESGIPDATPPPPPIAPPPGTPGGWPTLRTALRNWAEALHTEADGLASCMAEEVGKPVRLGRGEAAAAAASITGIIEHRETARLERTNGALRVRRAPLGRVAVITPWNNPLAIPAARLAAALAYGNSAVWKPSPRTPRTSRRLEELARAAGCPPDLLTVVHGPAAAGGALLHDPTIQAVAFSGSLARGREVLAACTARMLPCQVELGGNNPAIIDPTADPDAAAEAVTLGALAFAGQRCTANRRAIVLAAAADRFRRALHRAFENLRPGPPEDASTLLGPVVDAAAARRIEALLDRAGRAARVHRFHSAARESLGPAFVPPAWVEDAAEDSEIVQEETFGPVLVLQVARDWDDALRLANGVRQGLAAALFSTDAARWVDFQRHVQAGVLKWNQSTAGPVPGAPFGGWKHSGWGGAEHAEADLSFFTRPQTILQRL